MKIRYIVYERHWTGSGFETSMSEHETREQVIGMTKLLIDEVRPFQISITDLKQTPPGYEVVSPKDIGQ